MDSPSTPPPLPEPKTSNAARGAALGVVLVVVGAVIFGPRIYEWLRVEFLIHHPLAGIDEAAVREREKRDQAMKDGTDFDSDGALKRLREQLERTAPSLSGRDAAIQRAIERLLDKIEARRRDYLSAREQFQKAQILASAIPDQATIDRDRHLVRVALARNTEMLEVIEHGAEMYRAELEMEKIPLAVRDACVANFNNTQALRPFKARMQRSDETTLQAYLAALDLLDRNWGQWQRDDASGQFRFQDAQVAAQFNTAVQAARKAAAERLKVQQEMVAKVRAGEIR
jgi:hypothetical protein